MVRDSQHNDISSWPISYSLLHTCFILWTLHTWLCTNFYKYLFWSGKYIWWDSDVKVARKHQDALKSPVCMYVAVLFKLKKLSYWFINLLFVVKSSVQQGNLLNMCLVGC
jgi:hypothetical protein